MKVTRILFSKDLIAKAIHSIVDKANVVVTEDLTLPIQKSYGKNQNRRLNGWVKGIIADSIKNISHRRCSSVVVVNAAYTSQTHHLCGSFGDRRGDVFYCPVCKVVEDADHNAAINVQARNHDSEINRWTHYKKVKSILLARLSPSVGTAQPGLQL